MPRVAAATAVFVWKAAARATETAPRAVVPHRSAIVVDGTALSARGWVLGRGGQLEWRAGGMVAGEEVLAIDIVA